MGETIKVWLVCMIASVVVILSPNLLQAMYEHSGYYAVDSVDPGNVHGKFQGELGDVIDLFNGGLLIDRTDLFLPGKGGLDVAILRSYAQYLYFDSLKLDSSFETRYWGQRPNKTGVLGFFWKLGLYRYDDSTIFYPGGGAEELFKDDDSAGYKFKTRNFDMWEFTTDSSGVLYTQDFLKIVFSETTVNWTNDPYKWNTMVKRIVHTVNRDTITFYYHYTSGKLTSFLDSLVDAVGRRVEFYYNNSDYNNTSRLKKIRYLDSDSLWDSVQYVYDSDDTTVNYSWWLENPLIKVIYPNGTSELYAYDTGAYYNGSPYYEDYPHNKVFALSKITLPTGGKIEYDYGLFRQTIRFEGSNEFGYGDDTLKYKWLWSVDKRRISYTDTLISPAEWQFSRTYFTMDSASHDSLFDHRNQWDQFRTIEDINGSLVSCLKTLVTDPYGRVKKYVHNPLYWNKVPCATGCDPYEGIWDYKGALRSAVVYSAGEGSNVLKEEYLTWEAIKMGYTLLADDSIMAVFPKDDAVVGLAGLKTISRRQTFNWQSGQLTSSKIFKGSFFNAVKTFNTSDSFVVFKSFVDSSSFDRDHNHFYIYRTKLIKDSIPVSDTLKTVYVYGSGSEIQEYVKKVGRAFGNDTLWTEFVYDNTTGTGRNNRGNLIELIDPSGNAFTYSYSSAYRYASRTKTTDPYGNMVDSTQYYFPAGLAKKSYGRNNDSTMFTYDKMNRPLTIWRPLESVPGESLFYDDETWKITNRRRIDENNWQTTQAFLDDLGRTKKTLLWEGGTSFIKNVIKYNHLGQIDKVSRPFTGSPADTIWTSFSYDNLERIMKISYPDTVTDSTYYGGLDTVETFVNGNRRSKGITDNFGRLIKALGNWNSDSTKYLDSTRTFYHGWDKLDSIIDPLGRKARRQWYDSFYRLSSDSTSDRAKFFYIYDKNGRLRFSKDGDNVWHYIKYDKLGRVKESGVFADSTTPTQANAYDTAYPTNGVFKARNIYDSYPLSSWVNTSDTAGGNYKGLLTEEIGYSGDTTVFFYDKRNRLIQKKTKLIGISGIKSIKYSYNYSDQIDTLTYPDSTNVEYLYHVTGWLKSITGYVDSSGTGFGYEPWSAVKYVLFNNNIRTDFSYNRRSRLTKIHAHDGTTLKFGRKYKYDIFGNIVEEDSLNGSGDSIGVWGNYTYDKLDQLITASIPAKNIYYGYDKNHNRTYEKINSDSAAYHYLSNTNKLRYLSQQDTVNYAYDSNGNMTQDKSKNLTLTYDHRNLPIKIIHTTPADTVMYDYNAAGERIRKWYTYQEGYSCCVPDDESPQPGGESFGGETEGGGCPPHYHLGTCWRHASTSIHYIYSEGQVIAEYNPSGNLIAKYIYGNGMKLVKVDGSGNKYYIHADQLGSMRAMTNASKIIVQTQSYYPFGEMLTATGANTDYKFNGKELDEEIGVALYYYGKRYYDAKIGRFISLDSIVNYSTPNLNIDSVGRLLVEMNPYVYVANNPINFIDPFGLDPNPPGYADFNVNIPFGTSGFGITFGATFDELGIHPYLGGGGMFGGGVFISFSGSSVVYGWNWGGQAVLGAGFQRGIDLEGEYSVYQEWGGGPSYGISSTIFYIFEGFTWDEVRDFLFGGGPSEGTVKDEDKKEEEEDEDEEEEPSGGHNYCLP